MLDGLWLLEFGLIAMDVMVIVGTFLLYRIYRRDERHPVWIQASMAGVYFVTSAWILAPVAAPIENALVPS